MRIPVVFLNQTGVGGAWSLTNLPSDENAYRGSQQGDVPRPSSGLVAGVGGHAYDPSLSLWPKRMGSVSVSSK